jgi:hypothetical protein
LVAVLVLSLLQANEDVSCCNGADHSKKIMERAVDQQVPMLKQPDK